MKRKPPAVTRSLDDIAEDIRAHTESLRDHEKAMGEDIAYIAREDFERAVRKVAPDRDA